MRLILLTLLAVFIVAGHTKSPSDTLNGLDSIMGTSEDTEEVVHRILENLESLEGIPNNSILICCYNSLKSKVIKLVLAKCQTYGDSNQRVIDIGKLMCEICRRLTGVDEIERSQLYSEIIRACLEELASSDWNILMMYAHSPRDLQYLILQHGPSKAPESCFPDLWTAFISNAMERVVMHAEIGWDISGYARQIEFLTRFKEFTPGHFKRLLDGPLPLVYPSTIYISWLDFTLAQSRIDLAFVAYQKGIREWQNSRQVWQCHKEDVEALIRRIALHKTTEHLLVVWASISSDGGAFSVLPQEVFSSIIAPVLYRLAIQDIEDEFSRSLVLL